MLKPFLRQVVEGQDLTEVDARAAMELIVAGQATPAQVGAFLAALRLKGETVAEITGFARVMRERATPVRTSRRPLVDTCGTGGDGSLTFNLSTGAALVAAGAGAAVAKHGNRAVSSRAGSADVLEALGVFVALDGEAAGRCLDAVGIGFLFAPLLHQAMGHVAGPRRELGFRTVFNCLGPLTNPAGAQRQVVGVHDPGLAQTLARVLAELGTERALVVHGGDGLDEISLGAETLVVEVAGGSVRRRTLHPADTGLRPAPLATLRGGDAATNAAILLGVLEGRPGPARDAVLLNAAAALVVAGLAGELREAVVLAARAVDSGAALARLEELRRTTTALAARPSQAGPAAAGAGGGAGRG